MSNTLQSNRPLAMALCHRYVFDRNTIYPILDHLTKLRCEAFNLVASLLPLLLWAWLRYFFPILNWGLGLWDLFWQDMKIKLKQSKNWSHESIVNNEVFLYFMRLPFSSPDFWSFSKCTLCDSKCWKRCIDYCLISLFASRFFFGGGGVERGNVQLPSSTTSHAHSWSQLLPRRPTEQSLARKIVRFEVLLGTGSMFCQIAPWDLVTVLPHLHLQLGNSRDSDPKQSHSAMRHNTDPVSRGSWPIHLYRRLTGPCMKRSHGTKTTLLAGKQCSGTLKRKVT